MQSKIRFEVVESSAKGYKFLWHNRHVLLPYALLPFLIKVGCYAAIMLLGLKENYLRQGLVLMPAYFSEGLLVALMIRMAIGFVPVQGHLFSQESSYQFSADAKSAMLASTIVYVLIQGFFAFVLGTSDLGSNAGAGAAAPVSGGSFASFAFVFVMMIFTLWAVRLAWLYVPVAMGYSMEKFMFVLRPFVTSFYMIGIMLLCTLPIGVVLLIVLEIFRSVLGVTDSPSLVFSVLGFVFESGAQIVLAIVSSVAMAYAVQPFFVEKSKK